MENIMTKNKNTKRCKAEVCAVETIFRVPRRRIGRLSDYLARKAAGMSDIHPGSVAIKCVFKRGNETRKGGKPDLKFQWDGGPFPASDRKTEMLLKGLPSL